MGTEFFWVITQRLMVIPYRHFGTAYRSHLQGQEICKCHGLAQNVFKEGMFFLKISTYLYKWLPAETQLADGDV
jgi:hypothetical protein